MINQKHTNPVCLSCVPRVLTLYFTRVCDFCYKQFMNNNINDKNGKITNAQIIEEQERLKAKYEEEKAALEQENLTLQNTITKKNNEIFEIQKENKTLAKDRDEWKNEAHANRRIEQEKKHTKATNDFNTEFIKLQAKKGWQWDESQGWIKA